MKRISYIAYFMVGVLLFSAPSCNLVETNVDPTRVSDVDMRLILPGVLSGLAYNQSANQARIPGIIMQQFIGFDAQQVAYTNYNIPEDVFNNFWRTGLYAGVLKDAQVLIDKAIAEGQPHYEGIGKIAQAMSYGMAASFFGDVPYTEALKGLDNLKPGYDSQESVYAAVQTLLDQAITALSQDTPPGGPGGDDIVFGGDADSWIATAKALKARYAMHLSRRNGSAASDALAQIEGGAIKSLAEQPDFAWESALTSANPLALFGIGRTNTLVIDGRFADWMDGTSDPRKDYYMEQDGSEFQFYSGSNPNLVWAQTTSIIPLISYVEVAFMKAEALHRTGAANADVQAALEEAIIASMEQIGLDSAAYGAYVANRGDVSALSGDEVLERIMEEAYVGMYGFAFQQIWTNFRRTGYPQLTPQPDGSSGLNPSGVIPVRFLYPASEAQTNNENLQAAKDRQGGALLDANTWAFQP